MIPFTSSGGGSGGGVRLVANTLSGLGVIQAFGAGFFGTFGGDGRIRVKAFQLELPVPSTVSRGIPGLIAPPAGFPSLRIASVDRGLTPATPQATFLAVPDITLTPALSNPITVNLVATNIATGTVVEVAVVTEGVATRTVVNSTPLAGSLASSTATASVNLPPGVSVIAATATFATAP